MQRTQISLTDEERRVLDAAARRSGRSLSSLIRDAVEQVDGSERSADDDLAAMRQAFGVWEDRDPDSEVLAGMRRSEEAGTLALLATLVWHPVDTEVAEQAGALGREWLPRDPTIDRADLAIAATVLCTKARLLTRNVRHFPMFPDLEAPY